MKTINNITVAIDFSVTARNAYRYAKELATVLSAALTIVHVKQAPVIVSDVSIIPYIPEDDSQLISEIEELVAEEDVMASAFNLKHTVKINIFTGDPVSVLTELSGNNNTDLIVIGTTGLADILTKIFGSTSLKVSNKAHCPVIIVPRDVSWQPIEQILFASNYDSMTPEFIQHIIQFALTIHAGIHFVNVRNYDPILEPKQKDIDWERLFVPNDSDLSYEKHTLYGNNTVEELKKYSEIKNISLMAFASKHRNFWENLAHKSITENMALSTTIPLMVMHLDDES